MEMEEKPTMTESKPRSWSGGSERPLSPSFSPTFTPASTTSSAGAGSPPVRDGERGDGSGSNGKRKIVLSSTRCNAFASPNSPRKGHTGGFAKNPLAATVSNSPTLARTRRTLSSHRAREGDEPSLIRSQHSLGDRPKDGRSSEVSSSRPSKNSSQAFHTLPRNFGSQECESNNDDNAPDGGWHSPRQEKHSAFNTLPRNMRKLSIGNNKCTVDPDEVKKRSKESDYMIARTVAYVRDATIIVGDRGDHKEKQQTDSPKPKKRPASDRSGESKSSSETATKKRPASDDSNDNTELNTRQFRSESTDVYTMGNGRPNPIDYQDPVYASRVRSSTVVEKRTALQTSFSKKDFIRNLKRRKQVLECSREEDTALLFELIRGDHVREDVRNMALVSICRYVFPDRLHSAAHTRLIESSILRIVLDAAEAKSLSVCNPIDFSQLTVGRVFARGAGGAIHEAVYKGEDVVLKKTSPNDLNFDPKAFYIESTIMTVLSHDNLLPCLAAGECRGELIMLLPRYDCSLDEKIEEIHELPVPKSVMIPQLVKILLFVCYGVRALHESEIVHRDLKPQNILIRENSSFLMRDNENTFENTSYSVVVADFGTSRSINKTGVFKKDRMSMNVGTQRFIAPEVYTSETYDTSVDVYSFGMMAYEVVTGRVAFEQGQYHIKSVSSAILEGQRPVFEPEDYDVIPPLLIKLIKLCWSQDPTERPTMHTVFAMLNTLYMRLLRSTLEKEGISQPQAQNDELTEARNKPCPEVKQGDTMSDLLAHNRYMDTETGSRHLCEGSEETSAMTIDDASPSLGRSAKEIALIQEMGTTEEELEKWLAPRLQSKRLQKRHESAKRRQSQADLLDSEAETLPAKCETASTEAPKRPQRRPDASRRRRALGFWQSQVGLADETMAITPQLRPKSTSSIHYRRSFLSGKSPKESEASMADQAADKQDNDGDNFDYSLEDIDIEDLPWGIPVDSDEEETNQWLKSAASEGSPSNSIQTEVSFISASAIAHENSCDDLEKWLEEGTEPDLAANASCPEESENYASKGDSHNSQSAQDVEEDFLERWLEGGDSPM